MKTPTLVSVCIPTRNSQHTIEQTLSSIIAQSYTNIEIIISDNASKDNTISIVRSFKDKRIRISKNSKDLGYSGNLNKLISLAKGRYIAIYHADDLYEKDMVKCQVQVLEQDLSIAGVFTLAKIIDGRNRLLSKKPLPFPAQQEVIKGGKEFFFPLMLQHGNFFVCPSSMVRKDVYKSIGPYTKDFKVVEDQDMWLRILAKHRLAIINNHLMRYRVHEKQDSMSYYSLRLDLSPEYRLYDQYISKKYVPLAPNVLTSYRKMKSIGYLFCAVCSVLAKNKKKKDDNITNAKQTYTHPFLSPYFHISWILTVLPLWVIRPILLLIISLMKLLGLKRKLNFLNFV